MMGRSNRLLILGVLTVLIGWMQGGEASGQMLRGRVERTAERETLPRKPALDRIQIQVDTMLTHRESQRRQEIAAQFAEQPLSPESRAREYSWVYPKPGRTPTGRQADGWCGTIERLTSTAEGTIVLVAVWPRHANGMTAIYEAKDGAYLEEYLYANGRLEFRKAILPPTPRHPISFVF